MHEHVAEMIALLAQGHEGSASSLSFVGAVVGATYPEEMKYIRTLMPTSIFLIPGYGTQGGGGADVAPGFLPDGTGAIVNASRSIIFASNGPDWKEAAATAAAAMAEDIRSAVSH